MHIEEESKEQEDVPQKHSRLDKLKFWKRNNKDKVNLDESTEIEQINFDDYIQISTSKIKVCIESFLSKYINKYRIAIVVVSLLWFLISLYHGAQIESLSVFEKFLYPGHPVQRALDWKDNLLWNDRSIEVNFLWGVE